MNNFCAGQVLFSYDCYSIVTNYAIFIASWGFYAHAGFTAMAVAGRSVMRELIAERRRRRVIAAQQPLMADEAVGSESNVLFDASFNLAQTVFLVTIGAASSLQTSILGQLAAVLGVDLTFAVVHQPLIDYMKMRALMASMREFDNLRSLVCVMSKRAPLLVIAGH